MIKLYVNFFKNLSIVPFNKKYKYLVNIIVLLLFLSLKTHIIMDFYYVCYNYHIHLIFGILIPITTRYNVISKATL